jgi:excalibur calcium-binding domain-containing protein
MRRIPSFIIGAGLVIYAWQQHQQKSAARLSEAEGFSAGQTVVPKVVPTVEQPPRYQCDGRVYCSQMTSCEEATWFLQHCPGTKMDGEGDGVPCEKQWCGHQ